MTLAARLASSNSGKLRELRRLLGTRVRLEPPPAGYEAPDESEDGYRENALLKARALASRTGEPSLADDSGLEVDALARRPGVHSARYAADEASRIARLLAELEGVPPERRGGRFRCVLALAFPSGREIVAEGTCEGTIAEAPRGGGGFGYDPIFIPEGALRTFGELDQEEKDRRSHRAAAARELLRMLEREP